MRHPLFILTLVALLPGLSSQCDNSACRQSINYGPSFSGPYSIFNTANIGYGQSYSLSAYSNTGGYNCRGITPENSCLNVKTVSVTLQELYCKQPTYVRILINFPSQQSIDNMCLTYSPLPDNPDTYITYVSFVYSDGNYTITSTVDSNVSPGIYRRSTAVSSFTQKFFASTGNDVLIGCTRGEYGNNEGIPRLFASTFSLRPLSVACVGEVARLVGCRGLPNSDLYVLPYKLPTKCVIQQPCSGNSYRFT